MLKIIRPRVPLKTQGTINRLKSEADANRNMVAQANIPEGKYFGVGAKCYLALTAIVSGEKLVPGRNCEEINVAEALNALNA